MSGSPYRPSVPHRQGSSCQQCECSVSPLACEPFDSTGDLARLGPPSFDHNL
ncbi:hypothetical protein PAXRUDRAFT_835419 [Paxillus rubicundulus Ve08.2h10]|uniref:Uncharacterized protein n=1 Tax=Paxillus rubicundulus Ve08.2h10 TaxID=930991 RepID=A0A0D0CYA7_9AGAM|nr:hypothetical protein PAXRUDRAFT_835419 [Paxillus rubicundulus Ve08.2h10]